MSNHTGHDVRKMYRTDGSNTTYLLCLTCDVAVTAVAVPQRCASHPAYDADYCPVCGTARVIGGNR